MKYWIIGLLAIFLFFSCSAEGAWDLFVSLQDGSVVDPDGWALTNWNYRNKLTFQNGIHSSDLSSFPVLVVLKPTRVDYGLFSSGGDDIRFIDGTSGTPLNFEIEEWNSGGNSYIWVNVPTIDAGSDDDYIYLYYGNGSAAIGSTPSLVWGADFRGVWHLNTDLQDSTANANLGQNTGSLDAFGFIANGQEFDGASFVRILDDPSLQITADLTLEAWTYKHVMDDMTIVAKHSGPGNERSYKLGMDYTVLPNGPYFVLSATGSFDPVGGFLEYAPAEATNTWQYIVGVHSGSSMYLYVDGVFVAQNSSSFPTLKNNVENVIIGAEQDGAANEFDGVIDEVRISATARSSDWISAQNLSMRDAFIIYSPVETE